MTSKADTNKKKVVPQSKAFSEIKSSATLSLGRTQHSNFPGCLENPDSQLQEAIKGENPGLT
jgi:hypothetical protein